MIILTLTNKTCCSCQATVFKLRVFIYPFLKAEKQSATASHQGSRQQCTSMPYSFCRQPQLSSHTLKHGVMYQMWQKAIWANSQPHSAAMQMPQQSVISR